MIDGGAYLGSGGVAGAGGSGYIASGRPVGWEFSINLHYTVAGSNVEPVNGGGNRIRGYAKFTSLNRLSASNIHFLPGIHGKRPILIPIGGGSSSTWSYLNGA